MDNMKYFRNKETINSIDADSLWKLEAGKLVLVDEDQYVAVDYETSKEQFYEVSFPGE
jgi:hypothetical protein